MSTVQVKLSNGTQHPLTVPSFDMTVSEFKKLAAPVIDIPAENQRIVFKGKVLKDADNLAKVGVEAGHAIHVVRSTAAPAAATTTPVATTSSTPASVTPTPTTTETNTTGDASSTPAAPVNPFAAIFGGQAGGAASTIGVDGTNPPHPAMNNMGMGMGAGAGNGLGGWAGMMGGAMPPMGGNEMAMLNNPMVMQMISQMMQNPQYMQMMAANNPMLQGMSAQQRDQMMQLMSNPQMIQLAMSMMQNGGAGMGGGMNPNAMAQAMAAMGGMGGMGGANGNAGGGSSNAAMQQFFAPPPVQGNPQEIYRDQLAQLAAMGFPNEQANIAALRMSQGNVEFAIERLLNSGGGGGW